MFGFEYRPPWAAAMALEAQKKTHLRRGWSFDTGYRTYCGSPSLKNAAEFWVGFEDIRDRTVADPQGTTTTCERCCHVWMNNYNESTGANA